MRLGAVGLLAGCALVAACASAPAPGQIDFPQRPVDIEAADLDPCTMLSPAQTRALGAYGPEQRTIPVNGQPSPTCVWLSSSDLGYGTQTIPIGADVAQSEIGATVIVVGGFGAVRSVGRELTGGATTCRVTVDAGPGQSIRVQAQATGERPRTDEEMCRIATDVTGMVMTTVVATVSR